MNRTAWIVFAAVCIGIIGSLILLSQGSSVDVSQVDQQQVQKPNEQTGEIGDHVYGNKDAKIRIIEYGDYQCPACSSAAPIIKQIAKKYLNNDVALIFRNFPLPSLHPNARSASAAAEAAGLQDRYWEMHDKLYSSQSEWGQSSATQRVDFFVNYASMLGLDTERFKQDMTSAVVANKINYDVAVGKKVNITGTPTVYINDKLIDQFVLDGKLVSEGTSGAQPIWSDQDAFEKLALEPAMRDAGITIKE